MILFKMMVQYKILKIFHKKLKNNIKQYGKFNKNM